MFFHYYGGWNALLEYQQMTGDSAIRGAILKLADQTVGSPELLKSCSELVLQYPLNYSAIAFAALHAQEPGPYQKFLKETLQAEGWRRLYQPVTENPVHWSGSIAFLRDNAPGSFFWANWAPYICYALGKPSTTSPQSNTSTLSHANTPLN